MYASRDDKRDGSILVCVGLHKLFLIYYLHTFIKRFKCWNETTLSQIKNLE
jgi:hypothetical protein